MSLQKQENHKYILHIITAGRRLLFSSVSSPHHNLKSFPIGFDVIGKFSCCSRSTLDQLTRVQQNKISKTARLTVWGTPAEALCVSLASPRAGIRFPSPFLCVPSSLRLGWVSIRNPPRFPSNPHKSICYFPSPLLPILSLFIHPCSSLSLSLIFFISPPLSHT